MKDRRPNTCGSMRRELMKSSGRKVRKMNNNSSGLNTLSVLQIIFLVLKLTQLIDWSWLWVLSPMWITFIIVVILKILVDEGAL